ncbi:MAG: HDOD domain-containing protein [Nitrospirae bacterium]|nr:HDOD domain-containing protein [Nitrospirota bacterium]
MQGFGKINSNLIVLAGGGKTRRFHPGVLGRLIDNVTFKTMQSKKPEIIELIQSRFRERGDFPGMSRTVDIIAGKTSSVTDTTVTELTKTILDDFALTNKLLKLVNSVFYINYQLGGKIGTVSRAVFILGYEQVKNAAVSLLLFENLGNKNVAADLKESIITSFLTGIISKTLAEQMKYEDTEEAFLCSIFHNLGKLLVAFYVPEMMKKVKEEMEDGTGESSASRIALGSTFEDIGISIAGAWNFPEKITRCMKRLPSGPVGKARTPDEQIQVLVNFSNELGTNMNDVKGNPNLLKNLLKRYEGCFKISEKQVSAIMDSSLKEIQRFAKILKVNITESPFLRKISGFVGHAQLTDVYEGVVVSPTEEEAQDLDDTQLLRLMDGTDDREGAESPDSVLTNGIQEVANAIMEATNVNDILRTILEVMFRGMKFERVLICIRSVGTNKMEGRFGFGTDIASLIKSFRFNIGNETDIFSLSLSRNVDVIISDANDPRFKSRIPDWHRKLLKSQTFLLFPLVINKIPIGLIYADKTRAGDIKILPHQITLLKTLRNQAVMAIQKKM